jgi:hypothetical protein
MMASTTAWAKLSITDGVHVDGCDSRTGRGGIAGSGRCGEREGKERWCKGHSVAGGGSHGEWSNGTFDRCEREEARPETEKIFRSGCIGRTD